MVTHGRISTYMAGCRCVECTEKRRTYSHTNPRQKAHRMANGRAGKVLREMHPDVYEALFQEALSEIAP